MAPSICCSKCSISQPIECFEKASAGKFGVRSDCRSCRKAYRESRKAITKAYHHEYYKTNKVMVDERNSVYRQTNVEYIAKEKIKKSEWFKNNREKVNITKNALYHNKKTDPLYALVYRIRNRTRAVFRNDRFKKTIRFPEYIGCSKEELYRHIESLFDKNMNWDRFISGDIHIDHIKPIGKATTVDEVYKLSHYTNLQPLWKIDNLKKGSK